MTKKICVLSIHLLLLRASFLIISHPHKKSVCSQLTIFTSHFYTQWWRNIYQKTVCVCLQVYVLLLRLNHQLYKQNSCTSMPKCGMLLEGAYFSIITSRIALHSFTLLMQPPPPKSSSSCQIDQNIKLFCKIRPKISATTRSRHWRNQPSVSTYLSTFATVVRTTCNNAFYCFHEISHKNIQCIFLRVYDYTHILLYPRNLSLLAFTLIRHWNPQNNTKCQKDKPFFNNPAL